MPRLRIFVACQKVVVSQEDNTSSLIAIVEDILVSLPEGAPELASRVVIPMRWYAFSHWDMEEGDASETFELKFVLYTEEGDNALEATAQEFNFQTAPRHRVYAKFEGFPVWKPGTYHLDMLLRKKGSERWDDVAQYPIVVKFSTLPPMLSGAQASS